MPPQTQYDYTKDPDFLKASPKDQDAYLQENDKSYSSATPQQRQQFLMSLQPTSSVESNAPPALDTSGSLASRTFKGIGRGLANDAAGIYEGVRHPWTTLSGVAENTKRHFDQAEQEPSTIGKVAEFGASLPILGPIGQTIGERAAQGDVAGAVSEGATEAAPVAIGTVLGERAGGPVGRLWDARAAIGRQLVGRTIGSEAAKALFPNTPEERISPVPMPPTPKPMTWMDTPERPNVAAPTPRMMTNAESEPVRGQYGSASAPAVKWTPEPAPAQRVSAPPIKWTTPPEAPEAQTAAPPPIKWTKPSTESIEPAHGQYGSGSAPPVKWTRGAGLAESGPVSGGRTGEIGATPTERQVQTIMQKNVITPEEHNLVERELGPDARMQPGEGFTQWRSRVTGMLKSARPRTE